MTEQFSYEKAGVSIETADAAKRRMAASMQSADPRVLNRLGPFASLFAADFPECREPVLVLKMEEPGSKQKLAFQHGRVRSIAYDLIHHLIDDIIVMGAAPLAVLDTIICGKLEPRQVTDMVDAMAEACRLQGCSLVGGETSEQPGVIDAGLYVLAAAIVGVVDRSRIIDGSKIAEGDTVMAVASNGLHTNGYSLVRALLAKDHHLAERRVGDESFLDAILRPHTCYYQPFRGLFGNDGLHGLAHITGGGIEGNLNRVMPDGLGARIDLGQIRILDVFKVIREAGAVSDADMRRTFNLGVGMTMVVAPDAVESIRWHLEGFDLAAYPIGRIERREAKVVFDGALNWQRP
ncbi:MAG: phosphoribosylformylglycinamidine cyclo-ligase [Phycisphaerae bacterium]|nr:phosphoribosylformylglycinamidine cyclo-ligase [Phycisphaerae bacterium]